MDAGLTLVPPVILRIISVAISRTVSGRSDKGRNKYFPSNPTTIRESGYSVSKAETHSCITYLESHVTKLVCRLELWIKV